MKQNLFWQTQLLHNVSSALAIGTKHASARTKLCVVPVEASMKGEPAKFLNSFSSQNAATAEELTQPGLVSVQYARKQPRRQEKHGTHAQENMRSQQLPLFQLYNPPHVTVLAQLHIWHKPRTLPGSPICTVCLFAPPSPDPLPIRTSPAPPASSLLFSFPSSSFALYINPSLKSQAKSGQGYQIS